LGETRRFPASGAGRVELEFSGWLEEVGVATAEEGTGFLFTGEFFVSEKDRSSTPELKAGTVMPSGGFSRRCAGKAADGSPGSMTNLLGLERLGDVEGSLPSQKWEWWRLDWYGGMVMGRNGVPSACLGFSTAECRSQSRKGDEERSYNDRSQRGTIATLQERLKLDE
jgi:hypothetical protein